MLGTPNLPPPPALPALPPSRPPPPRQGAVLGTPDFGATRPALPLGRAWHAHPESSPPTRLPPAMVVLVAFINLLSVKRGESAEEWLDRNNCLPLVEELGGMEPCAGWPTSTPHRMAPPRRRPQDDEGVRQQPRRVWFAILAMSAPQGHPCLEELQGDGSPFNGLNRKRRRTDGRDVRVREVRGGWPCLARQTLQACGRRAASTSCRSARCRSSSGRCPGTSAVCLIDRLQLAGGRQTPSPCPGTTKYKEVKNTRRRWSYLAHHFETLAPRWDGAGDEPATVLHALNWEAPGNLGAGDVCCTTQHAGIWLARACDCASGTFRLDPEVRFPKSQAWVHAVCHSIKSQLVASLLAINIPRHRVMQGHVDVKAPTFFWVACYAEAPTQEQEKESGTWRHSLAWRIKQETAQGIDRDPVLSKTDKIKMMWQKGTLHLLTAAPRTRMRPGPHDLRAPGRGVRPHPDAGAGLHRAPGLRLRLLAEGPAQPGPDALACDGPSEGGLAVGARRAPNCDVVRMPCAWPFRRTSWTSCPRPSHASTRSRGACLRPSGRPTRPSTSSMPWLAQANP